MRSVESTSLRRRLGIVTCVFLALVIFASGLSGLMIRTWDRTLDDRTIARNAATDVSDLRLAYSDQDTGIRGYLMTLDETFLEPYRDGAALEAALIRRLDNTELRNADAAREQIAKVRFAGQRWKTDVVERVLAGDSPPDEDLARERFDDLRSELDVLDGIVTGELTDTQRRSASLKRSTFGVLIASAIAALMATALVAMLFRRWVTQPLSEVARYARLAADDNSATPPEFESAEIQDVADAITHLQASITGERDRALRAYAALEQSAVLTLGMRAELSNEFSDLPPGWKIASRINPAEGLVAGDCFDVGLLDQQHMYLIMIDVTGHGAHAALDALKAKTQLRAALRSRLAPGAALEWLSRENRQDDLADMLTAVACIIHIDTGECRYANAGHPGPLLTDGVEVITLGQTGPLLGAFPSTWQTETVTIPPGSTLVVYTDGVTDALGPDRERFGEQRLSDAVTADPTVHPQQLVDRLAAAIDDFSIGDRSDDITMLVLRRDRAAGSGDDAGLDTVTV